jgi:ClpP class serine protease
MTGQRASETGLVDHIGDYTDALEAAAKAAGIKKPRASVLQPRRSLSQKLLGRPSTEASTLAGLSGGLQRLLSGGIYYLDPAYIAGWSGEN